MYILHHFPSLNTPFPITLVIASFLGHFQPTHQKTSSPIPYLIQADSLPLPTCRSIYLHPFAKCPQRRQTLSHPIAAATLPIPFHLRQESPTHNLAQRRVYPSPFSPPFPSLWSRPRSQHPRRSSPSPQTCIITLPEWPPVPREFRILFLSRVVLFVHTYISSADVMEEKEFRCSVAILLRAPAKNGSIKISAYTKTLLHTELNTSFRLLEQMKSTFRVNFIFALQEKKDFEF